MITLTLLHPGKTIPIQHWTFDTTSAIRIGRSIDNEVVLYSAVVSRHHLEIRHDGNNWELINISTNGTYVEGKQITKTPATDGMIIRLAISGPQIQIHLAQIQQSSPSSPKQKHQAVSDQTIES